MDIVFVINPVSGYRLGKKIIELIPVIMSETWPQLTYRLVKTRQDGIDAHQIPEETRFILAMGGDGTAAMVILYAIKQKLSARIGIIPFGVGNDLALFLGFSPPENNTNLKKHLKIQIEAVLSNPQTISYDIFMVNQHPMINYFSIGYDAYVLNHFLNWRKKLNRVLKSNMMNRLLYLSLGLIFIHHRIYTPIKITLHSGDTPQILEFPRGLKGLVVSNVNSYAGGSIISKDARCDDSIVEILVIKHCFHYFLLMFTRFFPGLVKWLQRNGNYYQAHRVEIDTSVPVSAQIDGESLNIADSCFRLEHFKQITVIKNKTQEE